MLTKEQILAEAKKLKKQRLGDLKEAWFIDAATWANEQNAKEITELVEMLGEVAAFSPAGSDTIPQWLKTRVKVHEILEKYEK